MKLLGAREFIKMPVGTYYVEYWQNTVEECFKIIDDFNTNPENLLNIEIDSLEVFGDNSGSMRFSGMKEDEDHICYYDANVVGDACPNTTLYLVIEEYELPNEIQVSDDEGNIIKLSKKDVIRIRNIFVNEVYNEYKSSWAFEELDKLSESGDKIVDIKIIK